MPSLMPWPLLESRIWRCPLNRKSSGGSCTKAHTQERQTGIPAQPSSARGIVIYGPVRAVKALSTRTRIGTDAVIYPASGEKHSPSLRALMKSTLPLLIKLSASQALDNVRVWGSRSDLSCHHCDPASHCA